MTEPSGTAARREWGVTVFRNARGAPMISLGVHVDPSCLGRSAAISDGGVPIGCLCECHDKGTTDE